MTRDDTPSETAVLREQSRQRELIEAVRLAERAEQIARDEAERAARLAQADREAEDRRTARDDWNVLNDRLNALLYD